MGDMSNLLHNATVDTLLERRSIRKFKSKPLGDDVIETLETVAQHAASSQFLNDWSAIRVTDPAAKKRLAEIGGQPYIATAPLLYVFVLDEHRNAAIASTKGVDTTSDTFTLNGSYRYSQAQNDAVLALHAMETAAYSLGLGCVILGSLLNDVPALIDLLNLPEYTYPVLGLAIGKPDQDPALKPRMPRSMQFFENEYPSNNETLLAGLQDFDEEVHRYYDLRNTERPVDTFSDQIAKCGRSRCDQQDRGSKRQAPRLPPRTLTELLLAAWFVTFFAGMRFNLLIERHVRVAGLWIAMREMPSSAEFAPIDPKFSAAFTPTLVGGLLGCCFVVIHDFVRFDTAFGYEIMHSSSVYSTIG